MAARRDGLPSGPSLAADEEGLRPLACEDAEGLPARGMDAGVLGVCSSEEGDLQPSSSSGGTARRRRWIAGFTAGAALLALALFAHAQPRREGTAEGLSEKASRIVELAGYFVRAKGSTQVTVSAPIKGVNYDLLMKDAEARRCLAGAVQAAVASTAAQGLQESDVWVVFASSADGVLAQADIGAGEILAPQVQKSLKQGASRLGDRISIYVGLKSCKPPLAGALWPVGQAASVPAVSIKCDSLTCPRKAEKAKGYASKRCSGATCITDCCDLAAEAESGARVFQPPPPPKAEKSPVPQWLQKIKEALEKPVKAECAKQPGEYYSQASKGCSDCPEKTFQPGGLDRCAPCPQYVRRRRADKCTECAEKPPECKTKAPTCSYLALATDGVTFTFGLQFKHWTPEVSVHLLQASSFTLLIAGKEHGENRGKVFFSFQPLNGDKSLPKGGFYVYSKRSVEPQQPYDLTVAKNTTHLCLMVVPIAEFEEVGEGEEEKEDEEPDAKAGGPDTQNCVSYTEYAEKGLFQMKQPGELSWGGPKMVERKNYKQTQGTIVMSFDIKNVPYIEEKLEEFEVCVQKAIALYAGPGFHTTDVAVSGRSVPKPMGVPPGHLPEGEEEEYIETQVEATLLGWGASANLLDEIQQNTEGLAMAVQRWLNDDRKAFLLGGRRLQELEETREVLVAASVGEEAERSCAGRTCPAGMELEPTRRCAGASCLETCCKETTCLAYRSQCSPMKKRPPLPVVTCKGKEDCDDKCCIGRCEDFDCLAASGEVGATYCAKPNASKLWYTASEALTTCCNKVLCCTQNRPPCLACQKCQSTESYCKELVKEKPDLSEHRLRKIGCIEEEVPDCNYYVKASFFLHQGTDAEPKMVNAVDVLPDARHVVSGGQDGMGWIWNVNTGEPVQALPGNTGPIYSVAAHAEPEYVTIGGEDGQAYTYFWRTGYLKRKSDINGGPLYSLTDFQEWRLLGLAYSDGFVRVYNFHNNAALRLPYGPKNAQDYADGIKDYLTEQHKYYFEKSDPLIRVASEKVFEKALEKMPPVPPSKVPPNPTQTWGPVSKIVYFPVNFNFATGHGDGIVRFWSAADGKLLTEMKGHKGPVTALWALPTSLDLFSGGKDGMIMKWNGPTGGLLLTINAAFAGEVTGLTVIPGTGHLYSSHTDGTVRRWKVGDGKGVCKFQTGAGRVNAIAHNVGSRYQIVTASQDGVARTWIPRR